MCKICNTITKCIGQSYPCFSSIHWSPVMPNGLIEIGQNWFRYGLVPDGPKPLHEPMLTCYHWSLLNLKNTCLEFSVTYPSRQSINPQRQRTHFDVEATKILSICQCILSIDHRVEINRTGQGKEQIPGWKLTESPSIIWHRENLHVIS